MEHDKRSLLNYASNPHRYWPIRSSDHCCWKHRKWQPHWLGGGLNVVFFKRIPISSLHTLTLLTLPASSSPEGGDSSVMSIKDIVDSADPVARGGGAILRKIPPNVIWQKSSRSIFFASTGVFNSFATRCFSSGFSSFLKEGLLIRASLRKDLQNMDSFRGFIETISRFSNRNEALIIDIVFFTPRH